MDLLYKEEHQACIYYDNSPRPAIGIENLHGGQPFDGQSRQCKIVFLLEGELTYMWDGSPHRQMVKGQMLLLPPDRHFSLDAGDRARILVVRLEQDIRFCECYLAESLLRQAGEMNGSADNSPRECFLLEMNPAMEIYAEGLQAALENGLCCKCYFETKTRELFYLFRAFYPKKELALFFKEMLHPDAYFFYFVRRNSLNYKTVTELAGAMNMSLQCFEKQFKTVFGMPAYRWMASRKAASIYSALYGEQTPLKELASRFGFSSKSSFSDFCRKNLGKTPGEIRKIHPQ
jgi:AraC-like DNA-binding protein